MASYELSGPADRDLTDIYVYSYRQFGESKADDYLLALYDCFPLLADQPTMGRSIHYLRAGYFRFEHAHHTVFYLKTEGGIRIMRVLHERMDPERHL
jgi:toxin ParE1/3/4